MLEKIIKKHKKTFRCIPTNYFSPVKLQLMGDYIQHTGGANISCLLDVGVNATTSKSKKRKMKFINDKDFFEIDYDTLLVLGECSISKICLLVINEFKERDYELNVGVDGILFNTISELSINLDESYIVLFVNIINQFNFLFLEDNILIDIVDVVYKKYTNEERTKLCFFNNKPNTAMLNDEYATINFEDFNIVIIADKDFKDELHDLKIERKQDSINAHIIVDSKYKYEHLCEFKIQELNECKDEVRDYEFKRIRHAITENTRVNDLFDALNKDDITKVGMLLTASHNSLLQDYEITTKVQEKLCNLISRYNALGYKMLSSKNNNSIFLLVKDLQIDNLMTKIPKEYKDQKDSCIEFTVTNIYK